MELKGTKINFLGDSITEGCGTSDSSKCFCSLIEKSEGAICRNYGIGGTRIARQIVQSCEPIWDQDYCSRIDDMDPDADIVVIFGGTNDFGHGDAPLGTMQDRTPETFYGALHYLYQHILEKYTDSDIIVITPLHRTNENNPRGDGNKVDDVGTLYDYVKIIREVAEYYSLPILDLFTSSGLQPLVPAINEKYFADGLHPNDEGHKFLARKIVSFIKAM